MKTYKEKLYELRALMKEEGIDIYYVPTADFHESEYVSDYFKARKYITGFTGSAGTAVITQDMAGLWTDGRYFIQAEKQLDPELFTLFRMAQEGVPDVFEFIKNTLPEGGCLGFDARTVNSADGKRFAAIAEKKNGSLKMDRDLIDAVWDDRPEFRTEPANMLDIKYTGENTADKLSRIRKAMSEEGADTHVITTLDDIAWIMNVRGNDVVHVPVVFSYMVINSDDAVWFVNKAILDENSLKNAESCNVKICEYNEIYHYVQQLSGRRVLLAADKVNYSIYSSLEKNNKILEAPNPSMLFKAIKNETELENIRKAHLLDGIACTKFMFWLKKNIGKMPVNEITASDYLKDLRAKMEGFRDISFETICAYGPNAAMMHYSANAQSFAELKPESFLLVDSGGHYDTGTTDITRTYALGNLSDEQKKFFTLTAKGNLNLANAVFLYGCTGINLDIFCRQALWKEGIDYQCGTGHGVGYLLSVHEGPNGIRWKYRAGSNTVFEEGMVTTDEPGVYLEGKYGIRIENELICKKGLKNEYGQFMYFENITYSPIDLDAIDVKYLSPEDIKQLNDYHKMVYDKLIPYMDGEEKEWLKKYTRAV